MAPAPLLPDPDRLDRLVTVLDAATAGEGWHQPHRLVSLEDDPSGEGGLVFGFRTLETGTHPLDVLLGFRAPKAWAGLGVVCFGWAAPAADDVDPSRHTARRRPSRHPARCRVRVVTLVDRKGREQGTATLEDGTVVDEPGSGTVSDALRRCLGLPTAPPPVGSAELFAAHWLVSVAGATPPPASWREVASLHPAMRLLAAGGHRLRTDELVGGGRTLHRAMPWEQLRLRAAAGRDDGLGIPPDIAEWMDDGMFARWALAGVTPLPVLLRECADRLDDHVLFRLRNTLRAWNLDPPLPQSATG